MTINPVQLAHGVTVTVNVPQMPQVCPAPEAPTPGGVTVPVQGGLTAEQFAHIVATVTAKVVEELGGQPGGGGAGIDDSVVGTDTTWSSQKTSDELAGKADAIITLVDMETGEEVAAIPIADAISGTYYLATKAMGFNAGPLGIRLNSEVEVNDHLPPLPAPNAIYAVRNPETGVITWHMPTLGG